MSKAERRSLLNAARCRLHYLPLVRHHLAGGVAVSECAPAANLFSKGAEEEHAAPERIVSASRVFDASPSGSPALFRRRQESGEPSSDIRRLSKLCMHHAKGLLFPPEAAFQVPEGSQTISRRRIVSVSDSSGFLYQQV